jgi:hypothetical protein
MDGTREHKMVHRHIERYDGTSCIERGPKAVSDTPRGSGLRQMRQRSFDSVGEIAMITLSENCRRSSAA